MIVTEENRVFGYSSQDSDLIGSDTEDEYNPASTSQDNEVEEITESFRKTYIERAPIRSTGTIHNRNSNVPIARPQTCNSTSGGGIIDVSNRLNDIFVPNYPTTNRNNFEQHFNINQEPEVTLVDIVNQDETLQDNHNFQIINESFNQELFELKGEVVHRIFQDLNRENGEKNCAFSNIPSSNSEWSSYCTYTESSSTTSIASSAEYSPSSTASTSDIPQSSDSHYSSDDAHLGQSSPDHSIHFTPMLNEYDLFDDYSFIPKTVNDAEERCTAKELVQKIIKEYPKERKRNLWVQANKKMPEELMIDIRELVESNIDDELEIRLYVIVEVFLKNASPKQCKEVFKTKPTISDLLERKTKRLLKRYIDEIVQNQCMDEN